MFRPAERAACRRIPALAAAFFMLAACAALAPRGTAAPVRVSSKRPRLFVPRARMTAIAARARGKLRPYYLGKVKKAADLAYDARRVRFTIGNADYLMARSLAILLCHRLEGGEVYLRKALALADALAEDGAGRSRRDQRIRLQVLAILYDWLHDDLPAAERKKLRDALVRRYERERGVLNNANEYVSGHAHFTTASLLLAAISLWDGSGKWEKELQRVLKHWEHFVEVARYVAADGGHHLGWRYGRSYALRLTWIAEALTTATGNDVFRKEKAWLSQLGYHCVYGLRPDFTYFRVGDTHRQIFLDLNEDLIFFSILAARYRDPHLAAFARRTLEFCDRKRGLATDAQYVFALLFFDPALPVRPIESLPLTRAFRRAGNYTLRGGWGPRDTVVLFRAMPWYHFNHERRDFGSFTLYCEGPLAIHGGTYQAGDAASDYNGSHLRNYAWRSIAHNTIVVFDPQERFCSPTGPVSKRCTGENLWSNDGGQMIRSTSLPEGRVPYFQPRNVADIRDPRFAQGNVTAYEDTKDMTRIVADATGAYRPDKVRLFRRHLYFLKKVRRWKQPVLVVYDEVLAADPAYKKTWLLHTVAEPRIEGHLAVIVNTTEVPYCKDSTPSRNDYRAHYSGKLLCQTLLPEDAQVRFVGGPGKEFWVNGKNYATRIREVDAITEPGIGRIEVSPGAPRAFDVFLHVLSPTSADDRTPPVKCSVTRSARGVILRIENRTIKLPLAHAAGR